MKRYGKFLGYHPICGKPRDGWCSRVESCEPEVTVGADGDGTWIVRRTRERELGKATRCANAPDLARNPLGEPKVAVGACGDVTWRAVPRRDGEFGDYAVGRHPPDLVVSTVPGEP